MVADQIRTEVTRLHFLHNLSEPTVPDVKPERFVGTGGCLCGAIRYQSDQPPWQVGYCHCDMCKKNVGGLFGDKRVRW